MITTDRTSRVVSDAAPEVAEPMTENTVEETL